MKNGFNQTEYGRMQEKADVYVYVARLPSELAFLPLYPKARDEEVRAVKNERLRRQKYYAWKLLEYALQDAFGDHFFDLDFQKKDGGKWTSSKRCFSLSHSRNALAVAVANEPVGVDVEWQNSEKSVAMERGLTELEKAELKSVLPPERTAYLTDKWVAKESIFKLAGKGRFVPSKIAETDAVLTKGQIAVCGEEYSLAVATEKKVCVKVIERIDLARI